MFQACAAQLFPSVVPAAIVQTPDGQHNRHVCAVNVPVVPALAEAMDNLVLCQFINAQNAEEFGSLVRVSEQ